MPDNTQLLKFRKGAVIVKESSIDSEAYLIHSGSVEVFQERDGRRLSLARLGPGQIFGELALILERPRSASVIAVEDTVVERFPAEAFTEFFTQDPKKLIPFLQVLFERFRTMDLTCLKKAGMIIRTGTDIQAASSTPLAAAPGRPSKIPCLSGVTPQAKAALAKDRNLLPIHSYPFRIGRRTGRLFVDITSYNDLYIDDSPPFTVSRNHCSINQSHEGRYFVQDRGSTLGTIVNGREIGGDHGRLEAPLDREKNELILGPADSKFRFEISLALSQR